MITTGKHGIQSTQEWKLDVNDTRQRMCYNLQTTSNYSQEPAL